MLLAVGIGKFGYFGRGAPVKGGVVFVLVGGTVRSYHKPVVVVSRCVQVARPLGVGFGMGCTRGLRIYRIVLWVTELRFSCVA